jgi:photosystem II stability/assembly factor-like uncharacterized protein
MDASARRILPFLFAFLMISSSRNLAAAEGAWTSNGPYGANVHALAASRAHPSTIYISTDKGVYRSVDGGARWDATALVGDFYLLVATSDPSIAYAVGSPFATVAPDVEFPFHRTVDGGATWVQRAFPPGRFGSLTADPHDPLTLYAVLSTGRYRSANGGDTWDSLAKPVEVSELPAVVGGMSGIAVDPGDSNVLYAAVLAAPAGVYRSTDRGATWNLTGLHTSTFGLLIAADGSRMYASTIEGLQVSTDRGGSWRKTAMRQPEVSYLAVDVADPRVLYVVYRGSFFRSSDGGETITIIPNVNFGGSALTIASLGPSAAMVGSERGITLTENAGVTWREASVGLRELTLGSLAVDPTNPEVVFASNWTGIFESRDGGGTWSRILGSPRTNALAIDPVDHSTLYAGGEGVQRSTDGGRTWQVKSPVENGVMLAYIADLLIDPNNRRRILASSMGVYRTQNGAESWDRVMRPDDDYWTYSYYYYPGPPTVTKMTMAPSDGATLYAGGWESGGFLYRSTDGGDTWSDLKNGFQILSLAVDACDPRILHAGSPHGIYRTIDGGDTFKPGFIPSLSDNPYFPRDAFIHALARDPKHPSSVFAGTSQGLFWSIDRGATWSRFEPPLEEAVVSIGLDPSGRFLYAATPSGVFTLERTFEACRDGPDRLCLIGAKYEVSVTARHPVTDAPITGHAIAEGDRFGYFSFPDVTGDTDFPEVFVKMVNASGEPPPYGGHDWVFHSSLTSLDYTLTVREPLTGRVRTYTAADSAPSATLTCGSADTSAFDRACEVEQSSTATSGTRLAAASGGELPLLGGRFRATIRATDPRTGRVSEGAAIPRKDGVGYFSLPGFTGDPSFPEVFVKMVDGRAQPGGSFWVFHTGLTDLEYTLTVTDTQTGSVKTYRRVAADGARLCGAADTRAFH